MTASRSMMGKRWHSLRRIPPVPVVGQLWQKVDMLGGICVDLVVVRFVDGWVRFRIDRDLANPERQGICIQVTHTHLLQKLGDAFRPTAVIYRGVK